MCFCGDIEAEHEPPFGVELPLLGQVKLGERLVRLILNERGPTLCLRLQLLHLSGDDDHSIPLLSCARFRSWA